MKRFLLLLGLLTVFGALSVGCTTVVARYTVVSNKKVLPSRLASCLITRGRETAEDSYSIIVIIPTRGGEHGPLVAVEKLIDSVPGGVAAVECEVRRTWFHFPFIYGYYGFTAEGKVLVDPVLRRLEEQKLERKGELGGPQR